MYKRYTVLAYSNDFGVMNDEKTGKPKSWSGKRCIVQELTFDESTKTAVQGLTVVLKCSAECREVPLGTTGTAYFDRGGKLLEIRGGGNKSN